MNLDQLLEKSKAMGYGDIHVFLQPEAGLQGFIAIHSTKLGPAMGGCRFLPYLSSEEAFIDALRLGQGMSYKAAMANLNYGGGKAVLMQMDKKVDRKKLFTAFGRAVNNLKGRFITAIDSGSELEDMDIVAEQTHYVVGTSRDHTDPSPHTAQGILYAMEAALQFRFGNKDFHQRHIAIQGMGHVGFHLATLLHARGASLTLTDIYPDLKTKCEKEFDAKWVQPDAILSVPCDIFSPCALGNVLNEKTIPLLKTSIVVGSANNQLGESSHADLLRQRDILYAPDFVANAGGLIFAVTLYEKQPREKVSEKIVAIYDTMLSIFSEAKSQQCSTEAIAKALAEKRLKH